MKRRTVNAILEATAPAARVLLSSTLTLQPDVPDDVRAKPVVEALTVRYNNMGAIES